ncbi:MAG: type II toxin-antitoxin system RelE/ParE family toxin [Candidatus Contendobacter sp.]|jgi:proteic killer suppression protein|nr:type II toxin-antitoxin system RelE/ParE family toxin [Candidatus Contendobacter sp.]
MIKSFRHKGLKALHDDDDSRGVKQDQVKRLQSLLARLESSRCADDMDLPGSRLHSLSGSGDLAGLHAVKASGNWRLIFQFDDAGNAIDVDLVDYH